MPLGFQMSKQSPRPQAPLAGRLDPLQQSFHSHEVPTLPLLRLHPGPSWGLGGVTRGGEEALVTPQERSRMSA